MEVKQKRQRINRPENKIIFKPIITDYQDSEKQQRFDRIWNRIRQENRENSLKMGNVQKMKLKPTISTPGKMEK